MVGDPGSMPVARRRRVQKPIRIIVTGGTFDKEYDEIKGSLYFKSTHVPAMLERARCRLEVSVRTVMMIDSNDMSETDRRIILETCKKSDEEHIIITHGTDTMAETARVLGKAKIAKTIVLTGAMIPYAFGSSDGHFNLGSALSFAQALPHGVYVAMNGRLFTWDNVRKNRDRGEFEELRD